MASSDHVEIERLAGLLFFASIEGGPFLSKKEKCLQANLQQFAKFSSEKSMT